MKQLAIAVMIVTVSATALGGLWAQSGTTSISASATGTAASGSGVTAWTSAGPDWSPVEGAVGVIDADHSDDDGDGGGLATLKVAASPASVYRVTVYLTDPDENVQAYSYMNMCMKVIAAVASSNTLTESASAFTSATSVVDHDEDGTKETADCLILNAEKGYASFIVSSSDGTLVDSSDRTSGHASYAGADARAFNIGVYDGAFYAKDASSSDNLSPEFTIEVNQS